MKSALPLVLAIALLATACSHSTEHDPTPASLPEKFVSWTVDGTAVTTDHYVTGTGGFGHFSVPALWVAGRVYTNGDITADVQFEVPAAEGTYVFGPDSPAWGSYEIKGAKYFAGAAPGSTVQGSGTVVVTQAEDHRLVGTFTSTGVSLSTSLTKTIANGRFAVPK